ncbi:hypothetical protein HA466_0291250 [Hirschfeldia incana]|nr:hypothetical protein HA466_0291250 [Hirschfeldia incana]
MARLIRCPRRTFFSNSSPSIAYRNPKIGLPVNQSRNFLIRGRCLSSGSYVSQMRSITNSITRLLFSVCPLVYSQVNRGPFLSPLLYQCVTVT